MKSKKYTINLIMILIGIILLSTIKIGVHAKEEFIYNYTGNYQEFIAPYTGKYSLETWGASGGGGDNGKGGYASGIYNLYKGDKLYIYVGGKGYKEIGNNPGGYNGGGEGLDSSGSGGGATDIRTIKDNTYSRIIVAGGGGGTSASGQLGGNGGETGKTLASGPLGMTSTFVRIGDREEDSSGKFTGAGGGGYLGGGAQGTRLVGGNGGSNYTGSLSEAQSKAGINLGNGKAKITYQGEVSSTLTLNLGNHISYNNNTGSIKIKQPVGTTLDLSKLEINTGYQLISLKDINDNEYKNKIYTFKFEDNEITAKYLSDLQLKEKLHNNIWNLNWYQDDNIVKEYILNMKSDKDTKFYKVNIDDNNKGTIVYPSTLNPTIVDETTKQYVVPYTGVYKIVTYGAKGENSVTQYKEVSKQTTTGNETHINYGANGTIIEGYVYLTRGTILESEYYSGGLGFYKNDSCSSGKGKGGYIRGTSGKGGTGIGIKLDGTVILASGGGSGAQVGAHRDGSNGFQVQPTWGEASASIRANNSSTTGSNGFITGDYNGGGYVNVAVGGGGGGYVYGAQARYSGESYIDKTKIFNNIELTDNNVVKKVGQSSSGKAYATIQPLDVELITTHTMAEVELQDYANPNICNNIGIKNMTYDNVTLTWNKPNDNGTKWKAYVESYIDSSIIQTSMEREVVYTSGINGYYYYVDTNPIGIVTKGHTYISSEQATVNRNNTIDLYIHIAAVDNAGNLGPTSTEKIPVAAIINYNINEKEINAYGDKVTTVIKGNINQSMVYYGGRTAVKGNISNNILNDIAYTQEGYKFVGWSTDNNYSITNGVWSCQFIPIGTIFTYDDLIQNHGGVLNLYAVYEPINYIIKFNGNNNWNTEQKEYIQKVRYDQEIKLIDNKYSRKDNTIFNNIHYDNGYKFIGWGAIEENNIKPWNKNKHDYINKQTVKNLCNIDNSIYNMYALWEKDISLTFKLNNGKYNRQINDIILKGTVYNNQFDYTFSINNDKTLEHYPFYTEQKGTVNTYGIVNKDGTNKNYTKININNGDTYRFLGWNEDKNSNEPDSKFIVYTEHLLKYKIHDDKTLYAIWEPVLTANILMSCNLQINNNFSKEVNVNAYTSGVNNPANIELMAMAGQQFKYEVYIGGKADTFTFNVNNDINNYYNTNPIKDNLNPINLESSLYNNMLNTNYKHGLNRYINLNNSENNIIRKGYIPLYLNKVNTVYENNSFTIENKDSYYYNNILGRKEVIKVNVTIYLINDTDENGNIIIPNTLDELKTRLKIRLLE